MGIKQLKMRLMKITVMKRTCWTVTRPVMMMMMMMMLEKKQLVAK